MTWTVGSSPVAGVTAVSSCKAVKEIKQILSRIAEIFAFLFADKKALSSLMQAKHNSQGCEV